MKRIAGMSAALAVAGGDAQMAKCFYEAYQVFDYGKTYELTGSVLEVCSDAIIVQNGNEKREVVRSTNTKTSNDLKIGNKVTI